MVGDFAYVKAGKVFCEKGVPIRLSLPIDKIGASVNSASKYLRSSSFCKTGTKGGWYFFSRRSYQLTILNQGCSLISSAPLFPPPNLRSGFLTKSFERRSFSSGENHCGNLMFTF